MSPLPATSPWLPIINLMMGAVCLYPMDNIGYNPSDFDPTTMRRLMKAVLSENARGASLK